MKSVLEKIRIAKAAKKEPKQIYNLPMSTVNRQKVKEAKKVEAGQNDIVRVYRGHEILPNGDIRIIGDELISKPEAEKQQIVHALAWILLGRRNSNGELELFIQQRSPHKKWNPGKKSVTSNGEVRANETVMQAAARELAEEVGAPHKGIKFIGMYENRPKPEDHDGKKLPHVNMFMHLALDSGRKLSISTHEMDEKESRWMTLNEIRKELPQEKFTRPGSHEIMEKVVNGEFGDMEQHFRELESKANPNWHQTPARFRKGRKITYTL